MKKMKRAIGIIFVSVVVFMIVHYLGYITLGYWPTFFETIEVIGFMALTVTIGFTLIFICYSIIQWAFEE